LLQVNLPPYSAKMQELDWNDLRYVLVLSRTRRLARAAHQLRVNETTIARRVARIEKVLGSRLFERVNGALLVTDIGQVVVRVPSRSKSMSARSRMPQPVPTPEPPAACA
jgi:Bacterial regulatory helix-turn-helix protein, lysR family